MQKVIALVALLITVVGLAIHIEMTARPDSGKQIQVQHGEEHEH